MSWFILALLCTLGWGLADVFYKKSSDESDSSSHLKIAVWVGIVMGLVSAVLFVLCRIPGTAEFFSDNVLSVASGEELSFGIFLTDIVKYSPASLCYIISMVIGYAGLRYLEISIASPVQNASGALSAVAMFVFFAVTGKITSIGEEFSVLEIVGTAIIVVGVILLAVVENREDRRAVLSDGSSHGFAAGMESAAGEKMPVAGDGMNASGDASRRKYMTGALALIFPILYCVFDTLGTAADGIILSEDAGLGFGEIDLLILYGITFFIFGLGAWIFMFIRTGRPYQPFRKPERFKCFAALSEEAGQFFYVYAMAARPMIAAPMIGSYCIVSVILSRIFLREKLSESKYACVITVIVGIVMLGIAEGLSEA